MVNYVKLKASTKINTFIILNKYYKGSYYFLLNHILIKEIIELYNAVW